MIIGWFHEFTNLYSNSNSKLAVLMIYMISFKKKLAKDKKIKINI